MKMSTVRATLLASAAILGATIGTNFGAGSAFAAVSPNEAAALKSTLTPLGAIKAGNAAGTIPAWTGGYQTVSPGYRLGKSRPDPFAGEKKLFSITGANVAQYADKLSDGQVAMLKKYPDYRLDIYPTHRTASAPQWVYDNTFLNATRASATENGLSVKGAYGGIPFPIPKTGAEAMWNHKLSWQGETVLFPYRTWVTTSDGQRVMASQADETHQYPYYFKDGSPANFNGDFSLILLRFNEPSYKAGEALLVRDNFNIQGQTKPAWQYLVGQRRVRRAPSVAYDTPDFVVSGMGYFDEAFVFLGALDRYDWKLLGEKEMYVPYNNNGAALATVDDLVGPKFLNPDRVRWELHRVWTVDATLAPGKRHVVPHRRFYLDEDTWMALLSDGWDAQGKLWRTCYDLTLLAPDLPGVIGLTQWGLYNLQSGGYYHNAAENGLRQFMPIPREPDSTFSPDALASDSTR